MLREKICDRLELLQFAHDEDVPTIFNLRYWLESKTHDKYTIVQKEFIRDILQALNDCMTSATNINNDLNKKWKDIIEGLK